MENEIKKILVADQTPVALTKIVQIINTEKTKVKSWQTALAFFIIVFIGWFCIHMQIQHKKELVVTSNKDSIISYQATVIGIQAQCLDSAIFLNDIR